MGFRVSGRRTGKAVVLSVCAGALLLASGCRRGNKDAPPPGENARAEKEAPPPKEEKRSAFSRLLTPDAPPGYVWDGQQSKAMVSLGIDAAFDRSAAALKALGFAADEAESKRQGASARIVALNASKTAAQLMLSSRTSTTTEIRVKVGATGDRSGSERILDEIQKAARTAPARPNQP